MKNNKLTLAACVVLGVAAAQTATASELGFYIGGYVGMTSKEGPRGEYELLNSDIQTFFFFTPSEQQTSFDETDTGFALFGGYRFTPYIAIEGGYTRLGQITFRSRATGDFPAEPGTFATNVESDTSGFTVSVLGTWPVTRNWEVFGRAGALFATNDLKLVARGEGDEFIPPGGGNFSGSFSKSTTDYYAGVGISRRVFEIYDVRLEFQRTFDAGLELTGGQADLDALFLGMVVTF